MLGRAIAMVLGPRSSKPSPAQLTLVAKALPSMAERKLDPLARGTMGLERPLA